MFGSSGFTEIHFSFCGYKANVNLRGKSRRYVLFFFCLHDYVHMFEQTNQTKPKNVALNQSYNVNTLLSQSFMVIAIYAFRQQMYLYMDDCDKWTHIKVLFL